MDDEFETRRCEAVSAGYSVKEVRVLPGTSIDEAARNLVAEAPAWCEFNGVKLQAEPGDEVLSVVRAYEEEAERRVRAWRASTEGQQVLAEMAVKAERCRAETERLMSELPLLDFADLGVVITWLDRFSDAASHVAVQVDRELILTTFASHGYEADVFTGGAYRPEREVMARWIVGQGLAGVRLVGSPDARFFHRFAEQWRRDWG